ncbi:response regulator [Erythrobacteraceae bacterium CFH 75059]|uniref:response regulator n=1 Tax=Qipengyuania thermophila TaxID=2509361 RepID=UPI0010213E8F|nr:response regulator [Qipengyuania thermophila]TCD05126.1 response regulator [Erythrobacteraceae bacterium CFH 75059]
MPLRFLQGASVLVLEDEPIIAFTLEDLLADAGAQPTLTCSIDEAMSAAAEGCFDFAILDVNINGSPSYPVASKLVERRMAFIFATGYGNTVHPEPFRHVPTIPKPYSPLEIARAIGCALKGAEEN